MYIMVGSERRFFFEEIATKIDSWNISGCHESKSCHATLVHARTP